MDPLPHLREHLATTDLFSVDSSAFYDVIEWNNIAFCIRIPSFNIMPSFIHAVVSVVDNLLNLSCFNECVVLLVLNIFIFKS